MKGFISKTLIFLGIFSLVMGAFTSFGTEVSFAEDLELIGRELGLVVTPESTRLFDLKNLNPGDTKEAKVDIKNNYTQGFELFMRTERLSPPPGEGDVDLFKQLIVTVYLGGEVLYSGPMINFATSNINLGRFAPGAEKELRAVVYLPGPETGNEFQGESVEVKWIFIAQADAPPPPPPPGPGPDPDPDPDPDPTPTPVTPTPAPTPTPELPEEEEIVEEIPEGIPDVEEEVEEPIEELEEIEEEIPEGQPRMPKTGEIPSGIYYGLGTVLLGLGIGTGRKKRNR